jgi:hypothetical protein
MSEISKNIGSFGSTSNFSTTSNKQIFAKGGQMRISGAIQAWINTLRGQSFEMRVRYPLIASNITQQVRALPFLPQCTLVSAENERHTTDKSFISLFSRFFKIFFGDCFELAEETATIFLRCSSTLVNKIVRFCHYESIDVGIQELSDIFLLADYYLIPDLKKSLRQSFLKKLPKNFNLLRLPLWGGDYSEGDCTSRGHQLHLSGRPNAPLRGTGKTNLSHDDLTFPIGG